MDVVEQEILYCLEAGIRPEQITVLAWSEAQVRAIMLRLASVRFSDDAGCSSRLPHVACVDSFSGRESDVIICDLVEADDSTGDLEPKESEPPKAHANANKGGKKGKAKNVQNKSRKKDTERPTTGKSRPLLSRARHKHRLILGLTRARYGLIIIGQGVALMRTSDVNLRTGHERSHVAALVRDAFLRRCYVRDTIHMDSHPDAIRRRTTMGSVAVKAKAELLEEERYSFFLGKIRQVQHGKEASVKDAPGSRIYQCSTNLVRMRKLP